MNLRRLLVVALIACTAVVVAPTPASACSCAGAGLQEMLDSHEAAFIGTLVSRRGGLMGMGEATWTFDVTQEVKGSFAGQVKVSSPASGAACGFEMEPGQEAAIFVRAEGERLHSGLCSTSDADALRAHLQPQRTTNTPATLLVAGGGPGRHLWLFDDKGGLAGATDDAQGDWLEGLVLCPGGQRAVELWHGSAVVRDLRTLRAVRTQPVPRNTGKVWCRNRSGKTLLGARRNNRTGDWAAIAALDAPRRPLVSGNWTGVDVAGDQVVATVGREDTQLRRISLKTGREALLHTARARPGVAVHVGPGIESFVVSPDQTRVAFHVTTYPDDGTPSTDVFVYDISSAQQLTTTHLPSEGAQLVWLDDASLAFSSYERPTQVLDATDLHPLTTLPEGSEWAALRRDRTTLVGMDGPRLSAVDTAGGRVQTLASVPEEHGTYLLELPRPLRVRSQIDDVVAELPIKENDGGRRYGGEVDPAGESLIPAPAAAAIAVTVLAAAVLILRARRRRV